MDRRTDGLTDGWVDYINGSSRDWLAEWTVGILNIWFDDLLDRCNID